MAASDPPSSSAFDVTLITQCSEDRVPFLAHIFERWEGPISAGVYVTSPEAQANATSLLSLTVSGLREDRRLHQALDVHFVMGRHGQPYPVNKLRNVAIQAVTTTHFLVTDVDLWPSRTLYNAFLSLPAAYLARERVATVVPAFETSNAVHKVLGAAAVPETFAGLRLCASAGMCNIFKHATDTHTSTLYDTWWEAQPGDDAYNVPCFDSIRYEPYLLVPKAEHTPAFDERFVGYGKNKIQWVQHVRMLGFAFHVLPQGFVIHVPHVSSKSRDTWNRDNRAKKNHLFMSFIREHMAVANISVPLCRGAFADLAADEYQ